MKIHSADAYLEISRFYSRSGRDEDAKLYFYRAFGIFASDGNRENSNYGESIDFYIHFAHRMANAKRGAMALPALMKAKALAERWYADTGAVFAQRWLYEIYNELGSFLVTQKRHNKAERGADYMRKAIELKRIVYTRTHDKRDDPDYMGYFRKVLEEYESQSEPLDTTSGNPPEEEYDYSDILHENPMMAGRDILIERYKRAGDPEALRELAYTL